MSKEEARKKPFSHHRCFSTPRLGALPNPAGLLVAPAPSPQCCLGACSMLKCYLPLHVDSPVAGWVLSQSLRVAGCPLPSSHFCCYLWLPFGTGWERMVREGCPQGKGGSAPFGHWGGSHSKGCHSGHLKPQEASNKDGPKGGFLTPLPSPDPERGYLGPDCLPLGFWVVYSLTGTISTSKGFPPLPAILCIFGYGGMHTMMGEAGRGCQLLLPFPLTGPYKRGGVTQAPQDPPAMVPNHWSVFVLTAYPLS